MGVPDRPDGVALSAPVWFLSHGSPLLALGRGHAYARALRGAFLALPEPPRAVVAVSAHWQTRGGISVTTGNPPGVMHDFGGFPDALYVLDHPAPGAPQLAGQVLGLLAQAGLPAEGASDRRLDHGVWSVLRHMDPDAAVPVVQVSLPQTAPAELVELGRVLSPLRREGVLILASGGLVHNLNRLEWQDEDAPVQAWAREAEAWVLDRLPPARQPELQAHRSLMPGSRDAAPTTEHLDPLFVALGAAGDQPPRTLLDAWQHGTLSLRCLAWEGFSGVPAS